MPEALLDISPEGVALAVVVRESEFESRGWGRGQKGSRFENVWLAVVGGSRRWSAVVWCGVVWWRW
jgi:hypothetical protein